MNTIAMLAGALLIFVGVLAWRLIVENSDKPSITVTWPTSGDTWKEGTANVIAWVPENIPDDYKISVNIRRIPPPPLQKEGQEFDPVVFTDLPNNPSADWLISDMYPSGTYVLTVSAYQRTPVTNAISGESQPFVIEK